MVREPIPKSATLYAQPMHDSCKENFADKILALAIEARVLAYFSIDNQGVLLSQGGKPETTGLPCWETGSKILGQATFLDELLPMYGVQQTLADYRLDHGRVVDIHLFEESDCTWIVMADSAMKPTGNNDSLELTDRLDIEQASSTPPGPIWVDRFRFFEVLNMLAMIRRDDGAFELLVPPSRRFASLYAEALQGSGPLYPQKKFLFVDNFLVDAEQFWNDGIQEKSRRSGPWVEHSTDGEEIALEATAVNLDGSKLLIIEILDENFERDLEFLQIGRENALLNKQLEQQNAPLKALIENIDQGVYLLDEELRVVIANDNAGRLMGLPEGFLKPGTCLADIISYQYENGELFDTHASVDEEIEYRLRYRREAKDSYAYERKHPDGSYLDIHNVKLPDGGWISTASDITERKQVELIRAENEAKLIELNQRLELANRVASLGIWEWDLKTNVTKWDDQQYKIFGLPPNEPINYDKWKSWIHPEDLPRARAAIAKMLETGKEDNMDLRIIRADGEVRYIQTRGAIVNGSDGKPARVVGVDWDITERLLAEKQIEDSRNQLQALADNLPEFIILKDISGRFLFINKRVEEWTGLKPEAAVGKTMQDIYPPEQAEVYAELDRKVIESGQILSAEDNIRYPDGRVRTVISTRFPVTSRAGEILGLATIDHDVTEAKRMEKLKSEFLSTVSHELRTPLTSIRGALDLVKAQIVGELQPATMEMVNIAHNNSERLLVLINDLLDIQKLESDNLRLSLQEMTMRPFIQQILAENTGYARDQGVEFVLKSSAFVGKVYADKIRLGQVMGNLLSNAAKFSPEGSTVEISVDEVGDHRIRVSVADSGPGIPDDFKDEIFERFTQLDSSDSRKIGGTGLGLAISRAIIDRHDGCLDFVSEVGVGSTFYFELPPYSASRGDHG